MVILGGSLLLPAILKAEEIYEYQSGTYLDARGAYTTSMSVTGQFTLGKALGGNRPYSDIIGDVLGYSFNDGVFCHRQRRRPGIR